MIIEDLEKYEKLRKNRYIIIPDFMDKNEAMEYHTLFTKYCIDNEVPGDRQVPVAQSIYNFKPFIQLMCNYTKFVSDSLGVNLLPTYSFARRYLNGSILKKHVDREPCEVSISLHLYGDKEWPLNIGGEEIYLNQGEAVLYWGMDTEHWRDPYEGEEFTQVFLHYVRTFGDHFTHMFNMPDTIDRSISAYKRSKNRNVFT